MRRFPLITPVAVLMFWIASALSQEFTPPKLTQYVTDQSGTLSSGEIAAISAKLEQFDHETSTQIVVLMVPTLGDSPVEEASLKVAELNKIGRGGKNNGILLFVAKNDRKIRIEVGYGLEGAVPDITAGQIIRREITPRFREGDYYAGIVAGVQSIMLATKNEYKAEPGNRTSRGFPVPIIFLIIIAFVVLSRIGRGGGPFSGRRGPGPFIFFPPGGGGWGGSGGSGGGGFGGGGFSGGGGSFGGGGASGSW
jgi:uncharacterized protein